MQIIILTLSQFPPVCSRRQSTVISGKEYTSVRNGGNKMKSSRKKMGNGTKRYALFLHCPYTFESLFEGAQEGRGEWRVCVGGGTYFDLDLPVPKTLVFLRDQYGHHQLENEGMWWQHLCVVHRHQTLFASSLFFLLWKKFHRLLDPWHGS